MKLYPAILSDSVETVQRQVDLCKKCSQIEVAQIDIVDGFFADNITISPMNLLEIDSGELEFDLHLMVEEPMDTLLEIEATQNKLPIRTVIAQIEKMTYQEDFIEETKKLGYKIGFSLKLYTPLDSIDDAVWNELDVVQLMGVRAGFQGQEISQHIFDKLKLLGEKKAKNNYKFEVIVDGGVKLKNSKKLIDAGADGLAVGSALWLADDFCQKANEFVLP